MLFKSSLSIEFSCFSLHLDFPNLPYLIEGDLKLTQSKAILYYLGRKLHLMGKTPAEEAMVMMLCEEAHDLRMLCGGIFYGPKGESADERKQFAETTLVEKLSVFETYFAKHSSKFAVGNQITVADFQLFDYIDAALILDEDNILLKQMPHLKKFLQTIRELPELKDYIAKAHAELPLNNKGKDRKETEVK